MRYIIALLLITGCVAEPQLASVPKDQYKYQTDLRACTDDADRRQRQASAEHLPETILIGLFPPAALAIEAGEDNDYTKKTSTIRDECLKARGYAVK